MKMEREKEREMELESAMYTNCLLLGLDPNILDIGSGAGSSNRVGLFRHSNPKLGEQLLFFILSSLRGPAQSAKDFDKVWPIFDPAQSREFRKVVQGIIIELESQGALPRSNSRVSSLATCCGPRFVELLWQLSLHALREVHQRNFSADLVSNPLPTSLTDVALSHAATLLPVTKGRIALERRRFLKNAETAVQRQATWSNLAHEMTAEFRGLCAEEAYLQQELEKLNELRNKVKMEGELGDELVSSSSQNHMVQRATRLWDSLLSRKSQHEVLASGPIEDLIAHREHRYRISGSALQAAMLQSSSTPDGELAVDKNHKNEGSEVGLIRDRHLICPPDNDDIRLDDKTARGHPTVDVAEVLRRWTHALQRIHKQSLQMEKTNDGEGPALLQSSQDGGSIGHAEALSSTLTEHRQHLASIQVLVSQLKEVAPAMHNSISELTEEVNSMSSNLPPLTRHHGRSGSPVQAQSSGRTLEHNSDDLVEMSSRLSSIQLEKSSASPSALKLPPLFSVTPNSSGKGGNMQKRQTLGESNQENLSEKKSLEQVLPTNNVEIGTQDNYSFSFQNLKRSVREAALSSQSYKIDSSLDSRSDDSSEHYFVPMSGTGFSRLAQDHKPNDSKNKQSPTAGVDSSLLETPASNAHGLYKFDAKSELLNDFESLDDYDGKNGFLSVAGSTSSTSDAHRPFYEIDETHDQVFSPPLLMESTLLTDSYEDLLAPLSETETALMEHC